jgi:hypothetical protein
MRSVWSFTVSRVQQFRKSAIFKAVVLLLVLSPVGADFSGPYALAPPAAAVFSLLAGGGGVVGGWTIIPMSKVVQVDTTGAPNTLILDAVGSCWMHVTVSAPGTVQYRYAILPLFGTNVVAATWSSFTRDVKAGDSIDFTPSECRMIIKDFSAPIAPPEIHFIREPSGYRVGPGQSVTLTALASFNYNLPFSYEWELNGSLIPGSKKIVDGNVPDYQRVTFQSGTGGSPWNIYRVLAKSDFGQVYSAPAQVLTVSPGTPRLLVHLEFEDSPKGHFTDSAIGLPVTVTGEIQLVPGRVGNFAAEFSEVGTAPNPPVSAWDELPKASLRIAAAGSDLELVNSSYTIAWWMLPKTNGWHNVFRLAPLFEASKDAEAGFVATRSIGTSGAALDYVHRSGPGGTGISGPMASGWQHFAILYDRPSLTLYIDGTARTTMNAPSGLVGTGRDDLMINPLSYWDGDSPLGAIDDFRVYNYALSSGEITALAGVPLPAPRLLILVKRGAMDLSCSASIGTKSRIETATSLGGETEWTLVADVMQTTAEQHVSTASDLDHDRYYRVRRID